MKTELAIAVLASSLCLPAVSAAQTAGSILAARRADAPPEVQGGRSIRVVAGGVETKIVTGRPYSAEAVTETVQVLGDGNRITTRSATRIHRDGEGRTRRETLGDDGSPRTISISDPVANVTYTLDPQTKTAVKANGTLFAPTLIAARARADAGSATVVQEKPGRGGRGGGVPAGAVLERTPAPNDPNVKQEELGTQNIEGVVATGTRTTTVIPAGQIGNAQEIRVVSERWFSEELQVLVMTKHNDPRSGETVYRLRNILRAEPDQNLFAVPSDYTVQERAIRQRQ